MRIPETRSEDLPPMRVNTVTMFIVGTVVWVLALVVVLILQARGAELPGAVQICLTGIGFGILALGWAVPQHRRRHRAERARAAEQIGEPGPATAPDRAKASEETT